MQKFSISFTLGKCSVVHQTNVAHSNREFIAKNVDQKRTHLNVTYAREDVRDAYDKLFGRAVAEYNKKQKRADRRITDYYNHIANGKREEAFYEAIVQFGDSKTAPCGSPNGKIVQQMLEEYVLSFQKRNPNLYIFNAVMHLDETSPHLHINFIPFYTKPRTNGPRVGVSMKAALDEMGFTSENFKANHLVAWEESERNFMETILHAHGYEREDKHADYAHMEIEEYKIEQDKKRSRENLRARKQITGVDISQKRIEHLQNKIELLEQEKQSLSAEKRSAYKSFYYSDPDKLNFVLQKIATNGNFVRETENGFEAPECYAEKIRQIEKQYRPKKTGYREKLRNDIDLFLMQSKSLEELLDKLQKAGYEIKNGKYIAAKPKEATNFIRLKSLGEQYSEYGLKNRIQAKQKFEQQIENQIRAESDKETPRCMVLQTIRFYTVTFAKNVLPMRKRDQKKPFSWTNDAEIDKLLSLNKMINEGASPESLRRNFEEQERRVSEWETAVRKSEHDLQEILDLKEKIKVVYEGKKSAVCTNDQARAALQEYPNITRENYRNIDKLVASETETLHQAQAALQEETEKLKEVSDLVTAMERVMGGTYVQYLLGEERLRRESDYIPNGSRQVGS